MRRMLTAVFTAVILITGLIAVSYRYYDFVSSTIFEESANHLMEIYHQANQSLHNLVGNNWSTMQMWVPYLRDTEDEKLIEDYICDNQEKIGFTDFYFISKDGLYRTVNDDIGYIDLKESLPKLILQGENAVVNSVVPGKPEIMVFAVPASPGTFHGFEYEAIAISYSNSDLVDALEIKAFNGQSSTYVIYPDGRVLVNNADSESHTIYNFFSVLDEKSDMTDDEIGALREAFQNGQSGVTTFKLDNESYYLVYETADFEDWTVLGVVPTNVVNASMNNLQSSTLMLAAGITVSISLFLLLYIIRHNRRKMKKKDIELLYREELFSALSNNVDDVFLMLDAGSLKVNYVSPNIKRLIGISEKEVRKDNRKLRLIIKDEGKEFDHHQLSNMISGGQDEWDEEIIHQNTGEIRWFHVTLMCRSIQGEKKFIFVMSDRTIDKKINQDLEYAVNAAQSASRAKSTFLSNMSHDIRTPMNAIIGFTTLATINVSNTVKVQNYLSKILSSSNHLLSIIDDVLDMSRIENGKLHIEETEVRLSEIMHDLYNITCEQIRAKNLRLHMDVMDVTNQDVYCDRTRLNQVLMNLLSNAIKFSLPGGQIYVSVAQHSGAPEGKGLYEFRVRDTGIGMSQEFVEHIFEPFERERTSTVSRIQGTGLGMAISKNIIDMMGGTIKVHTEEGKGTEFIIHLTFRLQPEKKDDCLVQGQENNNLESILPYISEADIFYGKKLLLAEDNELNREIMFQIFEEYGFIIESVEDGAEAVKRVEASKGGEYDLILMDIQMPVMDGYEATRRIRALPDHEKASVPVIAVTASVFDEDRKAAKECGMDGLFSKPINMEEVIKVLKKVLAQT